MKLFVWANTYGVAYGHAMFFAIAENVEDARKIALRAPGYSFGEFDNNPVRKHPLGEPTRVEDLPCGEWHEWSE